MRVAIMAAGGVGGYLGARLANAGREVAMLARGRHLQAIRENGLSVATNEGTFTARPALATDDPAEIGPVDVVVFAVKLRDTEAAAEACRPLIGPDTVVIPFQNGVESSDIVGGINGAEHAAARGGYIALSNSEPGRLNKVGGMERFCFAEADGRRSPRIEAFREAVVESGVNAPPVDDIRAEIWRKFAFLAPMSGMTAASRSPMGVIRGDEHMREVFRGAVSEVVAVARARGIAVPDDLVDQHMRFIEGLAPEMTSSQAHDLAAGRPIEVDGLSGAVKRLGREVGVATPIHATLHAVLRPFAAGTG
jgi:2-dehydropantoate 2-reductase